MLDLIRLYVQELSDGRFREMSLHRSGDFLYLMSLITPCSETRSGGLWTGEIGLLYKPDAGTLLKKLHNISYDFTLHRPYHHEAPITFGGTVERVGLRGEIHKELCTDIGTVSLFFRSPYIMQEMVNDLETALRWAA